MSTWRSVALLLVLLIVPPAAQAFTLEDLTVPGAQFTAGPLVFRDFDASVLSTVSASPNSLADISVLPLDVGGFTLETTFFVSGRFETADLMMTFTVATTGSAPIGGFTLDVNAFAVGNLASAFLSAPPASLSVLAPKEGGPLSSHVRIDPTDTLGLSLLVSAFEGACWRPRD